jgi:hypothetical protein
MAEWKRSRREMLKRGHLDATGDDPRFQKMMLEGIEWAMGMTQTDVTPSPFPQTSTAQGQRQRS